MAHGWDPSTVLSGSHAFKEWKCSLGHVSRAKVQNRARGVGCPICAGQSVLAGFNDLATTHPDIAAMAHGWDPTTVIAGSHRKHNWQCDNGHIWSASPNKRALAGRGCPECTKYGYSASKDGWLYFLSHPDKQLFQIGITNSPQVRLRQHQRAGWEVLGLRGPMNGDLAKSLERDGLAVLKSRGAVFAKDVGIEKFDGFTESWTRDSLGEIGFDQLIKWIHAP